MSIAELLELKNKKPDFEHTFNPDVKHITDFEISSLSMNSLPDGSYEFVLEGYLKDVHK